ncbi:hypothetical protein CSE45_0856 [Citreicella sp. SE45]|nr:hypothetical protein CSE45_0856 [Citreicella sp. SE45]
MTWILDIGTPGGGGEPAGPCICSKEARLVTLWVSRGWVVETGAKMMMPDLLERQIPCRKPARRPRATLNSAM